MQFVANPVIVEASQIVFIHGADPAGVHLELEGGVRVVATPEMTSRYMPSSGDYWVVQSDGYTYLNPKDVFERKYSPFLGKTGTHSEGKLRPDDEGDIQLAIGHEKGCVVINFGSPVAWIGLPPDHAIQLVAAVNHHLEELSKSVN